MEPLERTYTIDYLCKDCGEDPIYKEGDLVIFTARENDPVPFNCVSNMERGNRGKVFVIKGSVRTDPVYKYYIETCDLTVMADEAELGYNFSAAMFAPYREDHPDLLIPVTFDDVVSGK